MRSSNTGPTQTSYWAERREEQHEQDVERRSGPSACPIDGAHRPTVPRPDPDARPPRGGHAKAWITRSADGAIPSAADDAASRGA